MTLSKFLCIDHPNDKIYVSYSDVEEMLHRKAELDTKAFLLVYRSLCSNLPILAAERALTRQWHEHPMFGINSEECKDRWATAFQKQSKIAQAVFEVLMERAV